MRALQIWSRRSLAAALAPALMSACASPHARQLVSVNLLDTEPETSLASPPENPQPPDWPARLETAFDTAKRMVVPVYLNGRGPFSFVVDTGANRSVVATDVAAICHLPAAGNAEVHGIAGAELTSLAAVRRLSVGEVVSSGLELPVRTGVETGDAGVWAGKW